ncbi:MAG: hypothetical protein ABEJ89_07110 [Haloarculaceae archaeon]
MTCTHARRTNRGPDRTEPGGGRSKTVLFCPDCGREGTLEDWERTDGGLTCPACGARVSSTDRSD